MALPSTSARVNPSRSKFRGSIHRVESVKVEVVAVIYLDQTAEGVGGAVLAMFDFRLNRAKEIRKSLVEQPHSPAEQAGLEERAAFYENAAIPQEAK